MKLYRVITRYEDSSRYRIHYRTFLGQPRAPTNYGRYRWLSYYHDVYHNVQWQHLSSGTVLYSTKQNKNGKIEDRFFNIHLFSIFHFLFAFSLNEESHSKFCSDMSFPIGSLGLSNVLGHSICIQVTSRYKLQYNKPLLQNFSRLCTLLSDLVKVS